MTQTSRAIPGAAVRGTASGVFFMAFLVLCGRTRELWDCKAGEFHYC